MQEKIRAIVEKAVWAPSGDNSQPWEFSFVDESTLQVHLIPHKDNKILNYKLSGTYVAHGALIENIVLLAGKEGLTASVMLLPVSDDPLITAQITFKESASSSNLPDPLAEAIPARHTNRKQYEPKQLSEEARASITKAAAAASDEITFHVLEDKKRIKKAAYAESLIQKIALETPTLHSIFFSNILWKEKDNTGEKQGLSLKSMELPPPVEKLFPLLSHWPVTKAFNKIGFSAMASKTNGDLFASSPAIGLVCVRKEEPVQYLEAGRVFERVWLAATAQGVSFQPISGLLFVARRLAAGETDALDSKHFDEISLAANDIAQAFSLTNGEIPLMMCRMGYSAAATSRSKRAAPVFRTSHA